MLDPEVAQGFRLLDNLISAMKDLVVIHDEEIRKLESRISRLEKEVRDGA